MRDEAVPTDPPTVPTRDDAPPARRRSATLADRRVAAVAIALAVVPLVASTFDLAFAVDDDFFPWGDRALMELRTRDVGNHPVHLGLFSRDRWSHPGPILFYLLAVPYRLSGGRAIGLSVGALVINGASIAGMALVARRRGGTALLLCTLVACGVLVQALGADFMRDYWVCFVTTFPFGLMLFLTWSMACGERWALPAGAVVASFLAQTHVGFVPVAIPLLAWGAGWLVWRVRSSTVTGGPDRWRPLLGAGALTAALLGVLWLPTLLEQLAGPEGNLGRIVEYFQETEDQPHTLLDGYRVTLGQFGLPPEWVAGVRPRNLFTSDTALLVDSPVPVMLVPTIIAAVAFWRWRRSDALHLIAVVGLGVAVSVAAVARTVGAVYEYRLRWTLLLPLVGAVAAAWALWGWATRRWPGLERRLLVPMALMALVALATVNTVSAMTVDQPQAEPSAVSRPLVSRLIDELPEGEGDLIVRNTTPSAFWYTSTVISELERRGYPMKVEDDPAAIWGRSRVHRRGDPVQAVLTVAVDGGFDQLQSDPPGQLVAYVSDLSPEARAQRLDEIRLVRDAVDLRVAAGELGPEEALRELVGLDVPGTVVAVFAEVPAPPD